jgi:hypothetical protein
MDLPHTHPIYSNNLYTRNYKGLQLVFLREVLGIRSGTLNI